MREAVARSNKSLSSSQVEFYHSEGYLLVEHLISSEACDRAIAAARTIEGMHGAPTIMQPHRHHPLFLELLRHPRITTPVEDLMGPPVDGLATQFFFAPPGTSGMMKHQDNYCIEAGVDEIISCWIALTDTDQENGCIIMYPKSHHASMVPVRALRQEEIRATYSNIREEAIVPDCADPALPLPMRRGSALFLHGAVVHESFPNTSSRDRCAFLTTYLRSGATFRSGNTAKRQAVPLL